jgi:hypothetical protein
MESLPGHLLSGLVEGQKCPSAERVSLKLAIERYWLRSLFGLLRVWLPLRFAAVSMPPHRARGNDLTTTRYCRMWVRDDLVARAARSSARAVPMVRTPTGSWSSSSNF